MVIATVGDHLAPLLLPVPVEKVSHDLAEQR